MTALDRDPATIARELLAADTSAIGGSIIVDGVDVLETTRAAQKVARAVIRVEELADRLDAEANRMGSRGGAFTARAFATEIRDALKGETRA